MIKGGYVSIHLYIHTRMYTRTHTHTHIHTCTYTHTHAHTHTCTYTHIHTQSCTHTHIPNRTIPSQDVVYSGSHNKVHIWRASEDFTVIKELQTQYGTIYAMAVTKAYLIVGQ